MLQHKKLKIFMTDYISLKTDPYRNKNIFL